MYIYEKENVMILIPNIANCCNNKPRYKTAGGCIWKFVE